MAPKRSASKPRVPGEGARKPLVAKRVPGMGTASRGESPTPPSPPPRTPDAAPLDPPPRRIDADVPRSRSPARGRAAGLTPVDSALPEVPHLTPPATPPVLSGRASPIASDSPAAVDPSASSSPAAVPAPDDDDAAKVQRFVDPAWTAADLADVDTDAVLPTDVEAEVLAYEKEMAQWREEREARLRMQRARPSSSSGGAPAVSPASAPEPAAETRDYLRRTSINNPKGAFSFDTLVRTLLPPEVCKLGADTVAEELVKVRTARLDSVALDDSTQLECLDATTHLYLSDNRLTELNGLENLEHLRVLVVAGNRVKSLLAVAGLELEVLDARGNAIEALEEDGVPVLPVTCQRLYLERNPCHVDPDASGYDAYVERIRGMCPAIQVLDGRDVSIVDEFDDAELSNSSGAAQGGAEGRAVRSAGPAGLVDSDPGSDNDEPADGCVPRSARRGAAPSAAAPDDDEDGMMDFDIEEEEARGGADGKRGSGQGCNQTQRPSSARYALPVADGVSSHIRAMTDDLLARYHKQVEDKVKAVQRADDAADVGGRAALRGLQAQEREAAASRPGTSNGGAGRRPGSAAAGRPSSARGRPAAPSADVGDQLGRSVDANAGLPRADDDGLRAGRPDHLGSARGLRSSIDGIGVSSLADAVRNANASSNEQRAEQRKAGAAGNADASDSGSDDSSEDEAYTGVRSREATNGQHRELQRELRFAMGHQCNVAKSRLNDMWDDGATRLRTFRDGRDSRFEGGDTGVDHSDAYRRALQRITDYTGKTDFDKYRVEAAPPPKPAPAVEQPASAAAPDDEDTAS